jgi:UDP-2,3-diacylglucosamine hydrolase
MSTLFISDLHLDDARPESTVLFEQFVRTEARNAEALYILGDLFEYWLGDDVNTETSMKVSRALSSLAAAAIPCYFMHGNRDFLVGRRFAAQSGMRLLPEEHVLDLYGTETLLMHGDSLCTDDVEYQQVRRRIRRPDWQKDFLSRSPDERREIANRGREQSREHQMSLSRDITDVNRDSVCAAFERHGVRRLIHGHTHRPDIHDHKVNGSPASRVVLGDWYTQGSVLRVTDSGLDLASI